ncbi:hypothetical protein F896_01180 [Acinetobacter genomosp. 15BJ]|uniref:Uncharacterized protein n=1 Tax=Acinetobacter genomosp. 15BJ TaxID=106651 RepID=R9B2D4_9GAMM|nr:hypothetical protein F896_01180 [Acinetobacter genomosp. 15BJ]
MSENKPPEYVPPPNSELVVKSNDKPIKTK